MPLFQNITAASAPGPQGTLTKPQLRKREKEQKENAFRRSIARREMARATRALRSLKRNLASPLLISPQREDEIRVQIAIQQRKLNIAKRAFRGS